MTINYYGLEIEIKARFKGEKRASKMATLWFISLIMAKDAAIAEICKRNNMDEYKTFKTGADELEPYSIEFEKMVRLRGNLESNGGIK